MRKIIICAILLSTCHCALAQKREYVPAWKNQRHWHIGIHTGLDIGGAVPWPLNKAIGDGDKMNATPNLSPAIGLSLHRDLNFCWSIVAEATYKTIALDAEIITLTKGQRFKDDNQLDVLFFGRAETSMSFSQLEFPVYLKYKISERNRVFLGGYYSHIFTGSSRFDATALDGRLQNPDDETDITIVNPSDPAYQNFNENLDNWDVGFLVGYERKVLKRFTLSGRFSAGFKDIFKPGENYLAYSMWNMRGTITLSYRIM